MSTESLLILRSRTVVCACALVLGIVSGCGGSSRPDSYAKRLTLDPSSSDFDALMAWYEQEIAAGNETVQRNLGLEFQEYLAMSSYRTAPRFVAAAKKIFALRKIDEKITPQLVQGVVQLARHSGHPEAREWIDGYSTRYWSGAGPILTSIGYLANSVSPGEAPSSAQSEKVASLLDEFENFGVKLQDATTRTFVRHALRGRFPRLLEHLQVGMPPSGEVFGPAKDRKVSGEHSQMLEGALAVFDSFFDKKGEFIAKKDRKPIGWKDYAPWLDVVRKHTSGRAAAAEGIAIARFGLDRDPSNVLTRFRSLPEPSLTALGSWVSEEGESKLRPEVKRLLEFSDLSTSEGRNGLAGWVTQFVTEDGKVLGDDPLVGGDKGWSPKTQRRYGTVVKLLEALGPDGKALARLGFEPDAAWLVQLLAVETFSASEPGVVARSLNARIDGAADPKKPIARAPDRVLTAARSRLGAAPGEEVDGFFLRLLSLSRSSDRAGVIAKCKERLGDKGFVEAVYRYMSGKKRYSQSEYDVFLETLNGISGVGPSV
ncbi:MAG: hypothetical protein AAF517_18430, partial [Planctomycetota bacterium]